MPPGRLDVTILGARNLKNTQTFGRQDPFIVVKVGERHFTSEVANDAGRNPMWNARFAFDIQNETMIYFTIRNRNVITSDSHLGDVSINLGTVFAEGKHDATAQVITGSGKVHGELSVILLFSPFGADKKAKGQGSTGGGYPTAGGQSAPGGFGVNPGMPAVQTPVQPPPPGYPQAGNYPPQPQSPSYGARPVAPPNPYQASSGYPPTQQYPPGQQYPPTGYPGSGYPPQGNYPPRPPGGLAPGGYPSAPQGGYFGPGSGTYGTGHGHHRGKKGKKGKK